MAQKNRRLTKHYLRMSKAWIRDGTLSFDIPRFALEDGIDEVRGRSVNGNVLGPGLRPSGYGGQAKWSDNV